MRFSKAYQCCNGFSIAELLITLALIGILAAFTVPPLLQVPASNRDSQYTAFATDTAYMIIAAYEQYRMSNPTVATTVGISALTPYMNYVKTDSSSTIDNTAGGSLVCGSSNKGCLALHNGAYLYYGTNVSFNASNTTNGLWIGFDPDGTRNSQPSLGMVLTYDGYLRTYGTLSTTYYYYNGTTTASITPGASDATWFTGF